MVDNTVLSEDYLYYIILITGDVIQLAISTALWDSLSIVLIITRSRSDVGHVI